MQNTKKLLFFMSVWKRPRITEICFMGLQRLRSCSRHEIEVLAVISEEEMIPLCEKYGVRWVMHENLPLGRKKNFGLSEALKLDFDYLIEIGSDDLLKNRFLELYEPLFKSGVPMVGLCKLAYINTQTGEAKIFQRGVSSTFGLGRAFKRDVLERFPQLWPDGANKGLDNASHMLLARNGIFGKRIVSDEIVAIDLKSDVNIWPFNHLDGRPIDINRVVDGLSTEEINAIKCLVQKESEILTNE